MIHPKLERGFAGLQAGLFGGIVLLAVMSVFSVLDGARWYSYPNLVAGYFYGGRSIGAGFGWHTVSGTALQLVISSVSGALFGLLLGGLVAGRRAALPALAWGVLTLFAAGQLYRVFSPIVLVYMPGAAALVGHMIYGVCLAGAGHFSGPPAGPGFGAPLANPALGGGGSIPVSEPPGGPPDSSAGGGEERPD